MRSCVVTITTQLCSLEFHPMIGPVNVFIRTLCENVVPSFWFFVWLLPLVFVTGHLPHAFGKKERRLLLRYYCVLVVCFCPGEFKQLLWHDLLIQIGHPLLGRSRNSEAHIGFFRSRTIVGGYWEIQLIRISVPQMPFLSLGRSNCDGMDFDISIAAVFFHGFRIDYRASCWATLLVRSQFQFPGTKSKWFRVLEVMFPIKATLVILHPFSVEIQIC